MPNTTDKAMTLADSYREAVFTSRFSPDYRERETALEWLNSMHGKQARIIAAKMLRHGHPIVQSEEPERVQ